MRRDVRQRVGTRRSRIFAGVFTLDGRGRGLISGIRIQMQPLPDTVW